MMSNDEITKAVQQVPERIVTQVAVNTTDIANVKDDIHDIRDDIKSFRTEAREDAKATRHAIIAFASAISVPIILAALKLALT